MSPLKLQIVPIVLIAQNFHDEATHTIKEDFDYRFFFGWGYLVGGKLTDMREIAFTATQHSRDVEEEVNVRKYLMFLTDKKTFNVKCIFDMHYMVYLKWMANLNVTQVHILFYTCCLLRCQYDELAPC